MCSRWSSCCLRSHSLAHCGTSPYWTSHLQMGQVLGATGPTCRWRGPATALATCCYCSQQNPFSHSRRRSSKTRSRKQNPFSHSRRRWSSKTRSRNTCTTSMLVCSPCLPTCCRECSSHAITNMLTGREHTPTTWLLYISFDAICWLGVLLLYARLCLRKLLPPNSPCDQPVCPMLLDLQFLPCTCCVASLYSCVITKCQTRQGRYTLSVQSYS